MHTLNKYLDLDNEILAEDSNLVPYMDKDDLTYIGKLVKDGYETDERSREQYLRQLMEWLKLAMQIVEKKNTPWLDAANIKYPLLSIAAIRFHAHAFPALVDTNSPVKFLVNGKDLDGRKARRAVRLGQYLSHKIVASKSWLEDEDRGILINAICGSTYKKTYADPIEKSYCSDLILAKDFVVNYWTKNLETCRRMTHILYLYGNDIHTNVAAGYYDNAAELPSAQQKAEELFFRITLDAAKSGSEQTTVENMDEDRPRVVLEQHRYLDLDGDGYEEPYIVTVDYDTQRVFRIIRAFENEDILVNESTGSVVKIKREDYFTKKPFIPNPDGSFYDIGLGNLLGPLNSAINTNLNQLTDAGTLVNRQPGFLAKGIRLKGGNSNFRPGEWKFVETAAEDLRKGIVPLPLSGPSATLYNLVVFLVQAGDTLGSTVDMMTGQNPGQNQPAATSLAVLEQGLKVFMAIHKRLFEATTKEYKILYKQVKDNIDLEEYRMFLDLSDEEWQEAQTDFSSDDMDVRPNADTSVVTQMQIQLKAQSLLQKLPLGLNVEEVTRRVLEAEGHDNIDKLLTPNPASPEDPEITLKRMELQRKALNDAINAQQMAAARQGEASKDQAVGILALAKALSELAKADELGRRSTLKELEVIFNQLRESGAVAAEEGITAAKQEAATTEVESSPEEETNDEGGVSGMEAGS